jgi:hypothetical protein
VRTGRWLVPAFVDYSEAIANQEITMDLDRLLMLAIPLAVLLISWWLYDLDRQDRGHF